MKMFRILIVEDQMATLESLLDAIINVIPKHFPKYSVTIAQWYEMAEELIGEESYDLILLDHRMPYADPECDEKDPRFGKLMREIGYKLIPYIRSINKETLIIGTSSLDKDELKECPAPDFHMSKMYRDARIQLGEILEQVQKGGK